MRSRGIARLLGVAVLAFGIAMGPAAGRTDTSPDDSVRVSRIASLARLWGAVKFFHPWVDSGDVNWDKALVETIPKVEEARSPEDFRRAVDHMLSFLKDPATHTLPLEPPPVAAAPTSAPGEPVEVRAETIKGRRIVIVAATRWEAFGGGLRSSGGPLAVAFKRCADADGIVLDLRRLPADRSLSGGEQDRGAWWFPSQLRNDVSVLLKSDLTLGTSRGRFHSGYSPAIGISSGGYYSGFQTLEAESVRAAAGPAAGKPMVVVVNRRSNGILDVLSGLQSAGVASLVFDGDDPSVLDAGETSPMTLVDGIHLRVRDAEAIAPDGRRGFHPDAMSADGGLDLATRIVMGDRSFITPRGTASMPLEKHRLDDAYTAMDYPDRSYRLLALFRFWNIIHYFYPYKSLMDRPWDETLIEFIPRFQDAKDATEYALAVMEMVARMQDSHGFANVGARADGILGTHSPAVGLRTLGGRTVVTFVGDGSEGDAGLVVGDLLLAIDGEPVENRRARIARYTAASTPQALSSSTNRLLLRGLKDSTVTLGVRGLDEKERSVKVKRTLDRMAAWQVTQGTSSRPVHTMLPEGFGYIDLVRLEPADVDAALETVRRAPATIIDIRGYPKGAAFTLAPRLADHQFVAAKFRRPYRVGFDDSETVDYAFDQKFDPGPGWKYGGDLVVLIDERAISQSEHSCLLIESAAPGRVTFMGTPTAGANGDVTNLLLPGGISVSFTGHDVRHADGRQLQRVGIVPDVRVEPTPKGLSEGKDEVLDAAVALLKKKFPTH